MSAVLPSIGSTGRWVLLDPFHAMVSPTERFTCQAVRRLSDYIAINEDPYTSIYQTYGLTEQDYQTDLEANSYIVSLQSETNSWLYVPLRFISQLPNDSGKPYQTTILGVSLGAIPTDTHLQPLIDLISSQVFDTLGIQPEITAVATSAVQLVDYDQHQQIMDIRAQRATLQMSLGAQYRKLQLVHDQTLTRLHALEAYIRDHLPH